MGDENRGPDIRSPGVPQRYSEDQYGPHNDILPRFGVSSERAAGQDDIGIHSRQERRVIGTQCRTTFTVTHGPVFYHLRTAVEQPRDLGQVQADATCVKRQEGIVWMALAMMMVKTWFWLADEVRAPRDMTRIRRLIERVRRCAQPRPLLFCTDSLCAHIRALHATCRERVSI